MNAAVQSTEALRAARIFALVRARAGHAKAGQYADLAQRLPQLLRQNGLAATLDYLRLLAAKGADEPARLLCEDWFSSRDTETGLHLAQLPLEAPAIAPAISPGVDDRQYRLLSRIALREAEWFKRFAQSALGPPAAVAGSDGEEAIDERA